jgi:fucose permease
MFGIGLFPGLIKPLEETYGLTHTQMGALLALGSGLTCIAGIVLGAIADRFGVRWILTLSMVATAVSALVIWRVEIAAVGIIALLLFQLASASYSVEGGLVFALYSDAPARGLNLFHGFQGMGRLLAPLLIVLVTILTGSWQTVFLISFLVHLGFAFLFPGIHEPPHPETQTPIPFNGILQALSKPRILLGMAIFMFLAGCQATMVTWLANYLEREAGFLQSQALLALTMMMVGYTGIRLFLGFTRVRVGPQFMSVALVLNIVTYVVLACVAEHVVVVYIVCLFLGLSMGAFWPCAASLLLQKLHGRRGLLSGVFQLGSALGAAISVSLVGWLGDSFSLRAALATTPVNAIIFVSIYCYISTKTDWDDRPGTGSV